MYFYLKYIEGLRLPKELGQGIDIKGDGGYVVGSGSVHASGQEYRWEEGKSPADIEIQEAPEWLVEMIKEKTAPKLKKAKEATTRAQQSDFPSSYIEPIIEKCPFMRRAKEEAENLPEPKWFAMLGILAFVEDGDRIAHEMSSPYPGYSEGETETKLDHVRAHGSPITCEGVVRMCGDEHCRPCEYRDKITTPVQLGRPSFSRYGLVVDQERYHLSERGVYRVNWKDGQPSVAWNNPIATLPIYPSARGVDVFTGGQWIELSWKTSLGRTNSKWLPSGSLNNSADILELEDSPISAGRWLQANNWLIDSKSYLIAAPKHLASRIGWASIDDDVQFISQATEAIEYVGPELPSKGAISAWARPLRSLVEIGSAGHLALSIIGLSAASPVVRLLGKRNPVIGSVAESSSGKSTVINYALSIFANAGDLTIPALSTVKGIQDRGTHAPDLPLFVDELQQLRKTRPEQVESIFYYFGTGQRRVTSSKEQKATGGERRYGVGFYAAESGIAASLQLGAQYRVIELRGSPLSSIEQSAEMQTASGSNYGVVGKEVIARINQDRKVVGPRIDARARDIGMAHEHVKGDDAFVIALVEYGLEILSPIVAIELPFKEVGEWLASAVSDIRNNTIDTHTAAWQALITTVMGMNWGDMPEMLLHQGHIVAWRGNGAPKATGRLEINPTSSLVRDALRDQGGSQMSAKHWLERGWLEAQGQSTTCNRRISKFEAEATGITGQTKVWRVTKEGMDAAGVEVEELNESKQVIVVRRWEPKPPSKSEAETASADSEGMADDSVPNVTNVPNEMIDIDVSNSLNDKEVELSSLEWA